MTSFRLCKWAPLQLCLQALLALCCCLPCLPAAAVTLGQESVLSALGDPIEVEIDVLQWDDIDLGRVEIALASAAEYESFDLTRLPVLEQLSFNLVGPNSRGELKVLVSTRDPVAEPYIELLLILRWPGGSLLREYVLLFDLPGSSAPAAVATAPVAQAPAPAAPAAPVAAQSVQPPDPQPVSAAESEPDPAPAPVATNVATVAAPVLAAEPDASASDALPPDDAVQSPDPAAEARNQGVIVVDSAPPPAPPASGRRLYQVREGDGLWSIAQQFVPAGSGENIYQMLLSLHDLNRAAFINGNISLLKANALLQIPDVADIEAVAADSAEALFQQRWDEGTQRLQTALRGEPLPEFSPLYESDNTEPGPQAEAEVRVPGEESGRVGNAGGGLLLPATTPVVVALSEEQPQTVALQIDEAVTVARPAAGAAVQPVDADPAAAEPAIAESAVEVATEAATGPGTESVNPYMDRVSTATRDLQQLLQNRALQISRLEQELVDMRQRMREAQQITAQLTRSLEQAVAAQQGSGSATNLLGILALILLLALFVAMGMLFKVTAQLRRQRALADWDDALDDEDFASLAPAPGTASPMREVPAASGIEVIEAVAGGPRPGTGADDEELALELQEMFAATGDTSTPDDDHKDNRG